MGQRQHTDLTPCREVVVEGIVQGVGFRPFVHALAIKLGLRGWVRNVGGKVDISVEGTPDALDAFIHAVRHDAPPLARVDTVEDREVPSAGAEGFRIVESSTESTPTIRIAPDAATCARCLEELFDPDDRRFRYPFICCTSCGPRLTLAIAAPWDRARTTMRSFEMCPDCRAEYEDPADRRFHAEPIACAVCGPSLRLLDSEGGVISDVDVVGEAARRLRRGELLAIKGLGGYHLACDATSDDAVERLRRRKRRDERPLAVMVHSVDAARRIVDLGSVEAGLLEGVPRPIVLVRGRAEGLSPRVSGAVADVGLMLPYTPLHHLLLEALAGLPIVLTSGNRSEEPIAYEDDDALARLGDVADAFLVHDRPIRTRCDDSVARVVRGRPVPVRRSRGFAPAPLVLRRPAKRSVLALGGHLKATFALGHGKGAILSHHFGDLDDRRALHAYRDGIRHYEALFEQRPDVLVHDLNPDYASSLYAFDRARDEGIERMEVQHHRAHVASCMAEHGLEEEVIGVAFDGAGLGDDDTIWGGEFFVGTPGALARRAHLRPVSLPGGEAAMREPWRMAVAHAHAAGLPVEGLGAPRPAELDTIVRMIERSVASPQTSSVGRLFDAVAALAGVRHFNTYEGQAAIELEALAVAHGRDEASYPFEISQEAPDTPVVIDPRELIAGVMTDVNAGMAASRVARRFHTTIASMIVEVCRVLTSRRRRRLPVLLTGGVFMNALLTDRTVGGLEAAGFDVYWHQRIPPNDGGLCLGQIAIALTRWP